MSRPGRPRLALDQNFPESILRCLDEFIIDAELVPLRHIDARLPDLDRPLLVALHQLGYPALITNNYKMLKNPRELAALMGTKLTVFAIEGLGDDPIRATGAVLLDLPGAMRRFDPGRPQVFWMRPRNPQPQDPWEIFGAVAQRLGRAAPDLYEDVRLSSAEIDTPVLS